MELGRGACQVRPGLTPVALGLKPQREVLLWPWVLGSQTPEARPHLPAGAGRGRSSHGQPAPTLQGAVRVAPRAQCSWGKTAGSQQDIAEGHTPRRSGSRERLRGQQSRSSDPEPVGVGSCGAPGGGRSNTRPTLQ